MNEKDVIKQSPPVVRQTRKSGGSVILTITDFAEEKELYIVKKEGNVITLTNIKIENAETPQISITN